MLHEIENDNKDDKKKSGDVFESTDNLNSANADSGYDIKKSKLSLSVMVSNF